MEETERERFQAELNKSSTVCPVDGEINEWVTGQENTAQK